MAKDALQSLACSALGSFPSEEGAGEPAGPYLAGNELFWGYRGPMCQRGSWLAPDWAMSQPAPHLASRDGDPTAYTQPASSMGARGGELRCIPKGVKPTHID